MNKKFLIILTTALIVILIAIGVLYFVLKDKDDKLEQNGSMLNIEPTQKAKTEKLTRYGKMSLQADKNSVLVGKNFSVEILMDTQNSNIVMALANIIYDAKLLELVDVDAETSSLSMAVIVEKEPGKLEIIRGEPGDTDYDDFDDGYNGKNGNLVILKFKALKKANTKIEFDKEKSSMLLDDGNGTEMEVELEDLDVEVK